jgi:hypothetical protein
MSAHPLTTFIYETFGQQFGELLLFGYGEEPSSKHRKVYLTESDAEGDADRVIELVSPRPPCRNEPLVLAALLKLLLRRLSISHHSHHLEFESDELLAELGWEDDISTRRRMETAIISYVRLLYDEQPDERPGRRTSSGMGGGYYHLLTGYIRAAKISLSGGSFAETLNRVDFDSGFIEGLRQDRVHFAGINFGALNRTDGEDHN